MPIALPRSLRRLALIAVAAGVLVACAANPVTGRTDLALISEAQEIELGHKNDGEVRKQYGVYADPELQAYVDRIGQRIAARSHRPHLTYHFTVLDTPDVNAFALPGGYVYITRGILAYLNSEAELAAVLGHEIGHVTARHGVRQYSAAMAANIGYTIGSIFAPVLATAGAHSLFNAIGGALLSGYGRDHELEADRLGAEYLARTDYSPHAMIDVIGVLKNQELFEKERAAREGREARVYHGVFASHPSNDQRLQEVVSAADKYRTVANGRVERATYLARLDGVSFGDSESQGIRRGSEFYHKELDFALHFPQGWRIENHPDRIMALSPGADALLQVELHDLKQAVSAQEYLKRELHLSGLRDARDLGIAGFESHTGVTTLRTPYGVRDTRVSVVYFPVHGAKQRAFVFFGTARDPRSWEAHDRAIVAATRSLHRLTSEERPLAESRRIRIVTARAGDSFARLAQPLRTTDSPEQILRLLNGKYPRGEPAAGEQIKTIQ